MIKTIKTILLITIIGLIISCSGYGKKLQFSKTEVYYTSVITKDEAQKLGEYLVSSGFADGNGKSVQLTKNKSNKNYVFRMVTSKKAMKDSTYDFIFQLMAKQLSDSVFNGNPVDFHVCDDTFKTVKELNFKN